MRYLISMIIGLLLMILSIIPAYAESVEDIHILKISAKDERAIVKTSDGEARMVKVGDEIGSSGKVAEISSGRIVIEGAKSDEIEKIIITANGKEQKIMRIKKSAGGTPLLYKAVNGEIER